MRGSGVAEDRAGHVTEGRPPSGGSPEVASSQVGTVCRIVVFGPRDDFRGRSADDATRDRAHRAASSRTELGPPSERRSLAGVIQRRHLASRSFSFDGSLRTARQRAETTGERPDEERGKQHQFNGTSCERFEARGRFRGWFDQLDAGPAGNGGARKQRVSAGPHRIRCRLARDDQRRCTWT